LCPNSLATEKGARAADKQAAASATKLVCSKRYIRPAQLQIVQARKILFWRPSRFPREKVSPSCEKIGQTLLQEAPDKIKNKIAVFFICKLARASHTNIKDDNVSY
jgi:hypothetical protein